MKKITSIIVMLIAFNFGYGQELASFSSVSNSGCSGTVSNSANITTTGICRGSGITENSGGTYNSRDWTTNSSLDSNDYLEWTITPDLGYEVDLSSMNITYDRSPQGPTSVDIQIDTGSGFVSVFTDLAVSDASEDNNGIDLSSYTGLTSAVTFRLYAYNASGASGTFDIEENTTTDKGIVINGVVSALGSCTSVSIWDGTSWSPSSPDLTTVAIIDGVYTTDAINGSFSACSLIINSGAALTVDDGYYVEVQNDATVEGDLTVENHGAFVQNDDSSSFSLVGAGTAVVAKTTAVLNQWYYYTYWSSPINGLTIGASPLSDSTLKFWFDAANYLDDHTVGTSNGVPDDIDDNGDEWQEANDGDSMSAGVGCIATHSRDGWIDARQYGYDFSGEFNNGVKTTSILYNGANGDNDWNLIGNPYPCALDFDAFYAANSSVVDGAAYLWSHRSSLSAANPGNNALNFSQNDYAIITAGSGSINNTDNGDGNIPNDYIPSGQGFFIAGLANGTITFNNSMRMADGTSNSQFFKNSKEKKAGAKNKIWVNLTSDNGVFNQILIAYVDGATNGNDGMAYDAPRNLASGASSVLYTLIDDVDKKFAIQGKAPSSLSDTETVKLGFKTNIEVATLYKLSLAQFQGEFMTNNEVYIKDDLLNKVHNLSHSDYTFTSEVGEFNDRFVIAFNSSVLLSTNAATLNDAGLRIIDLGSNNVQFTVSNNVNIKSIDVYDTLGRNLYKFVGGSSSEIFQLTNLNSSVFIAKVELSNGAIITRKATKK